MKRNGQTYKIMLLLYSIFEIAFCSGAIFGWVSLYPVLKKENIFHKHCHLDRTRNLSNIVILDDCPEQESKLNIAYTIGCLTVGIASFPAGTLLDKYGPRLARFIGCGLFALSALFWGLLTADKSFLLYPAVILMSTAGVFSSYSCLQVAAFLYTRHQSTVLGLQNGAFNASAIMLQLIKLLYEFQDSVSFQFLFVIYNGASCLLCFVSTVILIPTEDELLKHITPKDLCIVLNDVEIAEESKVDIQTEQSNLLKTNLQEIPKCHTDELGQLCVSDVEIRDYLNIESAVRRTDSREPRRGSLNYMLYASVTSLSSYTLAIRCQKENNGTAHAINEDDEKFPTFWSIVFSGVYLWHVYFCSINILRQHFYVSSFEALIKTLSNNNEYTVDRFVNVFGTAQVLGFVVAPALGPYIDNVKQELSADDVEVEKDLCNRKMRRCNVALIATNSITIIMGIVVLIPVLKLQFISMVAMIVIRGFFYGVHFSYFAAVFPPEHYGKLSCFALLIGVLAGALQYPLFMLVEKDLQGNPFWVNVGLLAVSLSAFGQSLHLKKYKGKKEKTSNNNISL